MALSTGAFPYDLNELLGGQARVLLAPFAETDVPGDPSDIFEQTGDYEAVTASGWFDLGATKDAFQYGRNIEVGGYEIQNVNGAVIEEVTSNERTVQVSLAQISPESLSIIEQQPDIEDIASATGRSAFERVGFGSITDLQRYRVAFVSRRSLASGEVVEGTGGKKRGRWVVGVGFSAAVSADNVQVSLDKGNLAAAQVTFKLFPDPAAGREEGQEYGDWFFEKAGTIALT